MMAACSRPNISPGGVPKQPIERAWVGAMGLDGDAHQHRYVHGGPHRAVSLLGIEAIERVQADGHPIEPGAVGETLTTTGIELSGLPIGTRLAIGDTLVLEGLGRRRALATSSRARSATASPAGSRS